MYTLIIKEEAKEDIANAYRYYEEQLPALGDRFLHALAQKLEQINSNPFLYSYTSAGKAGNFRNTVIHGFPYIIVYEIDVEEILVYMVHNTHKQPRY